MNAGRCLRQITVMVFAAAILPVLPGLPAPRIAAQAVAIDAITAEEEFRWGVRAFNNGQYNEAIRSFNRALAYDPENAAARSWLGRAYYFSGFDDAAIDEWNALLSAGDGTAQLQTWVETLQARRGLTFELKPPEDYLVNAEFSGQRDGRSLFVQPVSVRPRGDGSFYLVSYGSGEILLLDANGGLLRTLSGGLEGFNRPFDVLELSDGTLLVSEFGGNRISRLSADGHRLAQFGGRGLGDGEMLGPQYLAIDRDENIYVTDWGNRRVLKFDRSGEYLLSFGRAQGAFAGLRAPTGITVLGDTVFVADAERAELVLFDRSGNHLNTIADIGLARPETLTQYDSGRVLIADHEDVVILDVETETTERRFKLDAEVRKLTAAVPDANHNILLTDQAMNKVLVVSPASRLYAGIRPRIDRVYSDEFPDVVVEVSVQDRRGRPILGLRSDNFIVTEDRYAPAGRPVLEWADHEAERVEIAIVGSRRPELGPRREDLGRAAGALAEAVSGLGRVRVVVPGSETPILEAEAGAGALTVRTAVTGEVSQYAIGEQFDLGVRFAAAQLLAEPYKRNLVYISDGRLSEDSFSTYDLQELAQFLRTHGIRFYPLLIEQLAPDEELEYLADHTGGRVVGYAQPRGLSPLVMEMLGSHDGRYRLSYRSTLDSDFGRRYIPIEVEVLHLETSGRDEAGYFAPLQF